MKSEAWRHGCTRYVGTREEIQKLCDEAHACMMAVDPDYAASVKKGNTTAWAMPSPVLDANEQLTGEFYFVMKDRLTEKGYEIGRQYARIQTE